MLRGQAKILQLNIGLYCNQACSHCHVESSPLRKEMMDRATAERCLHLAQDAVSHGALTTLDITGGAPELNSQFRSACFCCAYVRQGTFAAASACTALTTTEAPTKLPSTGTWRRP